jgi:hypothetical protein
VGCVGMSDRCSFPIIRRGERARARRVPRSQILGEPWCAGGDRPSSWGTDWPGAMAGQPRELASQPAILADGTLAPPMTSFIASKVFSRFIDATKAHNMTLAGGASFNYGVFLTAVVVDRALKGSMVGERINKSFGR